MQNDKMASDDENMAKVPISESGKECSDPMAHSFIGEAVADDPDSLTTEFKPHHRRRARPGSKAKNQRRYYHLVSALPDVRFPAR